MPAVKEKFNLLKETIEDTQENFTLSKDTDAKTGHKSAESSFFGYKCLVLKLLVNPRISLHQNKLVLILLYKLLFLFPIIVKT
jgi:hypothetical protein